MSTRGIASCCSSQVDFPENQPPAMAASSSAKVASPVGGSLAVFSEREFSVLFFEPQTLGVHCRGSLSGTPAS